MLGAHDPVEFLALRRGIGVSPQPFFRADGDGVQANLAQAHAVKSDRLQRADPDSGGFHGDDEDGGGPLAVLQGSPDEDPGRPVGQTHERLRPVQDHTLPFPSGRRPAAALVIALIGLEQREGHERRPVDDAGKMARPLRLRPQVGKHLSAAEAVGGEGSRQGRVDRRELGGHDHRAERVGAGAPVARGPSGRKGRCPPPCGRVPRGRPPPRPAA